MTINSPHVSASGGNENSSGSALPRSLLAVLKRRCHQFKGHSKPSAAECCTCLPVCQSCLEVHPPTTNKWGVCCVAPTEDIRDSPCSALHTRDKGTCLGVGQAPQRSIHSVPSRVQWVHPTGSHSTLPLLSLATPERDSDGSFGCAVIYHLAHVRLTRIQRLFGAEACSTPALNHTQQGFFHSSSDGVLATATKICARRHLGWDQSQRALRSPMSNLHSDALL